MTYNIILLHHFYGFPDLIDECSNNIRYVQVLRLLGRKEFPPNNTIFFCCTSNEDKRLQSIQRIAELDYNYKWINYLDDKDTKRYGKHVQSVEDLLNKTDIELTPTNTNLIIGGTNTTGCILRRAPVSVTNWTDLGFNVKICLSMCVDYQSDGISAADGNQRAAAILYQYIKANDIVNQIDVFYDILDCTKAGMRRDWRRKS